MKTSCFSFGRDGLSGVVGVEELLLAAEEGPYDVGVIYKDAALPVLGQRL